ncbi:hypothetical protein ASPCAL13272 [Aspergillus calidoustus]|uniref:BTB domain-containing protein n=1 Tax=Aspergillus calidoustus TaxID=454130 RepID=A0A0U5GEN7_ASPCI|nr:hypothetical protein ASPCAL13272 [Aspergillus calidoustus]
MPTHVVQRGGDLFLILRHLDHTSDIPNHEGETENKDPTAGPFSPRKSKRRRVTTPKPKKKRNYGPNDHRIRVSSAQLIKSSPFFKVALTGGWKETVRFQNDGDMEVGAPDWDIDALLVVMRLVHNKPRKLPTQPSFELLTGVSIIADYYQCRDAVLPYEKRWKNILFPSITSMDIETFVTGLWVASFFGCGEDFRRFSIDLLEHSHGTLDSGGLPLPQNILGTDTICDRRRIMLDEFITSMWHYKAALYDPLDMKVLNRFILDNGLAHAALPLADLTIHRLRREFGALDLPITWLGERALKQLTPEGLKLSDWV